MKSILLLVAMMSANLMAEGLPLKLTKVNADYLCQNDSGGVAFKLPTTNSNARVWQVDPGEVSGVEILLKHFEVQRCPGCFSFEGQLSDQVLVFGEVLNYQLTYKISDLETGTDFVALEAKCQKVK